MCDAETESLCSRPCGPPPSDVLVGKPTLQVASKLLSVTPQSLSQHEIRLVPFLASALPQLDVQSAASTHLVSEMKRFQQCVHL